MGSQNLKKSQAAIEFLFTYGWIFMLLLGFIGGLGYMGYLDFYRYMPEECDFGNELDCFDYVLSGDDNRFDIALINRIGVDVHVIDIDLMDNAYELMPCTLDSPTLTTHMWQNGNTTEFSFINCDLRAAKVYSASKAKIGVRILYRTTESEITNVHELKGFVFTKTNI